MRDSVQPSIPPAPTRRPWITPVLREYGSLEALTANGCLAGPNMDGSGSKPYSCP